MAGTKKRGLGRGFDALIPTVLSDAEFDVTAPRDASGIRILEGLHEVEIDRIDPNPHQPRQSFDDAALAELADSIREHGIMQPLVVSAKDDRFELIAGERRLRAGKLAGLKVVPAIVRTLSDQHKLELALIENLQRADLNPIETATAYRKLLDQFNMNYDQIGKRVGKDRTTVANVVRLLGLPLEAKRALSEGNISEGHARVVLTVGGPEKQAVFLEMIQKHGWSVRQTEEFARAFKGEAGSKEKAAARIAPVNERTMRLSDYLGTKVTQVATAKGGKLIIEYRNDDELDRIASLINFK